MFTTEDKERLHRGLAAIDSPLTVTLHRAPNGSAFSSALDQVARQLEEAATGRVAVERDGDGEVPIAPSLTIADRSGRSIRYAALPEGPETAPFLAAVLALAGAEAPPAMEFEDQLRDLRQPTELLVLIAPGCPHCPRAVEAATRLAIASASVHATIVDAMQFAEFAARFAVKSVPVTVINDGFTAIGVIRAEELAEHVLAQGTDEYARRTFRSLVECGRFPAAAEQLRQPGVGGAFHEAWKQSSTSTRMGLMLTAEEVLEQDAASLDELVPGLCELLTAEDAALRGDTADLLGKIGHPAATEALSTLLADPNPDVVEIAEEALEEVRKPRT